MIEVHKLAPPVKDVIMCTDKAVLVEDGNIFNLQAFFIEPRHLGRLSEVVSFLGATHHIVTPHEKLVRVFLDGYTEVTTAANLRELNRLDHFYKSRLVLIILGPHP